MCQKKVNRVREVARENFFSTFDKDVSFFISYDASSFISNLKIGAKSLRKIMTVVARER